MEDWFFKQSNRFLKNSNYYRRIVKLKEKQVLDETRILLKQKFRASIILRTTILNAMYNLKTPLGLKMFDIRLKLDGLDNLYK